MITDNHIIGALIMKVYQFHFHPQRKIIDDFCFLHQQDQFDLNDEILNSQGCTTLT